MKRERKRLAACLLTITMLVGCLGIPVFAEKGSETVLDCSSKSKITAVTPLTADTAIVHEGKYSAMWRGTDAESIRLSIPKDITPYTELYFWVHAAENCMVYLMFSSENTATDGSDYYGDKLTLRRGWQEVSVDIGKLTVSRTPRGYDDIDYLRISATGWSMTNDLSKFELHFDTITLKNNPAYTKLPAGGAAASPKPSAGPTAPVGDAVFYNRDYNEAGAKESDTIGKAVPKTNKVEVAAQEDGNQYIKMTKTEPGTDDCFYDVSFSTDAVRIVADVSLSYDGVLKSSNIQYKDKAGGNSGVLTIGASGELTVAGQSVGKLKKGEWTDVSFAFDVANNTCDVYISGKKMLSGAAYGGAAKGSMAVLRIYMGTGDVGAGLSFDNFRIYEGIEPRALNGAQPEGGGIVAAGKPLQTPTPTPVQELFGSGVALYVDHPDAYADSRLTKVDGQNEAVTPVVINDRTLVPIRFVAESFGAQVGWDEMTQTATVQSGADTITLVIGSDTMYIGDTAVQLDVAAQTMYDRTMLPLRAVAEALGKNVFWDDRGLILITEQDKKLDAVADSRVVDGMLSLLRYGEIDSRYNQSPRFTQSIVDEAIDTPLIQFTSGRNSSNVGWGNLEQKASKAMYFLTLAEYLGVDAVHSKTGKKGVERVLEQLRALISGGNEPFCCSGPYLAHSEVSSVLLLAKYTPAIWDALTETEIEKLDWLMRGLAITGNWSYNDANDYKTGFDLTGNFNKGWNPNYKNTYIPVVGNACLYFGGAEALNEIFASFDYDLYMKKFKDFGFTNIMAPWAVAGKDLMENGGPARLTEEYGGGEAGTGAGVKIPFTYNGFGLDELGKIAQVHIKATYDATVVSSVGTPGTDAYAYIVSGKPSPYEGMYGMMYEFVSGDAGGLRSSASYGHASQVTLFPYVTNLVLFGIWDRTKNEEQDAISQMMYVGNEDLIFKLEQGYHSYQKGASTGDEYESTFVPKGYAMDKEIWRKVLCFAGGDTTLSNAFSAVDLPAAAPKDGIAHAPEGALSGVTVEGVVQPEAFVDLGGAHRNKLKAAFDLYLDTDVLDSFDGVIAFVEEKTDDLTYTKMNVLLQMKSMTFNAMDGAGYKSSEIIVAPNYQYHVTFEIDVAANTYSAYMTPLYPEAGEAVCIAKDFSFRESAGRPDALGYMVLVRADAAANYWIENLVIE